MNKTNDIQTIDADYIERRDEVENILSQQKIPYTLKTPLDAIRTKEADKEAGKELLEKRGGAFGY